MPFNGPYTIPELLAKTGVSTSEWVLPAAAGRGGRLHGPQREHLGGARAARQRILHDPAPPALLHAPRRLQPGPRLRAVLSQTWLQTGPRSRAALSQVWLQPGPRLYAVQSPPGESPEQTGGSTAQSFRHPWKHAPGNARFLGENRSPVSPMAASGIVMTGDTHVPPSGPWWEPGALRNLAAPGCASCWATQRWAQW